MQSLHKQLLNCQLGSAAWNMSRINSCNIAIKEASTFRNRPGGHQLAVPQLSTMRYVGCVRSDVALAHPNALTSESGAVLSQSPLLFPGSNLNPFS